MTIASRSPRRSRSPARMLHNSRSRSRRLLLERLEERALLAVTPIQVFLMVGQSNMDGAPSIVDLPPPYDAPQSDVWIWQDDLSQNIGWTSLRGGFGGDSNKGAGGDGSRFGPEVSLGRSVEDALPESQFAIIKHVQAGVAATMQDGWNPDRDGGTGPGQIWVDFVDKTYDALNALAASQLQYEIAGLFVAQGHRDINNETGVEAANYQQNFTDFIGGVRLEFGVPQLPVVFAQVTDTFQGSSLHEEWLLVRNAQEAVDIADPLATMIEVDDLSRLDGVHQDAEGQITQGQRLAAVYLGVPYEGSDKAGSDGFETGGFSGGYEQWSAGAWTALGDVSVTTTNSPHVSTYHAQLRSSTGDLIRAVDIAGLTNVKLRFWSKLDSFETGDKASVQVSADAATWTTVREFVDGEDDNLYRVHEIDIPDIGDTPYVRFDAQMNELTDDWYIDDVKIVGTTGGILAEEAIFPNDPSFSGQWPLHNTGQTGGTPDADIDAPEAWSVTTGSMATVVAILDAGVDYTHPDLYLNMWLNPGEVPAVIAPNLTDADNDGIISFRDLNAPANASYVSDLNANGYIDGGDLLADRAWENGIDEDGNSRTDDLVGWDFHDSDNDPQVTVDPHGTDKSLIIGGMANNGIGEAGIVWSVQMMPIRIKSIGGEQGDMIDGNAVAGLDYGVASRASISYQGYRGNPPNTSDVFSQEIYDAIGRARQAGQLVVAAAGNFSRDTDVQPHYPGSYDLDNIITAAALDENNQLSSLTNWGATTVDIGVPSYGGATSNSLAVTTGVAALLKSAHPNWTYAQIKSQIMATVDALPSLAGKTVTGGRLNAANALGVAQFSISDATATEGSNAAFTITLNVPAPSSVSVNYATANASALSGSDFTAASGTVTFAPGQTSRTILVQTLDDTAYEGNETFVVNLSSPVGGVISDSQGVETIIDNDPLPTKFYVVDDGAANQTFEYDAAGAAIENYAVASGNSAPRGAASTAAGDRVWVGDVNRNVYVYDPAGGLVGSWTAGSLPAKGPQVQGIAADGTDVWIVDGKSDRVYFYSGAASRTSGSQNAASSFALNSGNKSPVGIVTDGTSLWVVNNATQDKVFKYTLSGTLLGSWTMSGGGGAPTGITLDPSAPSDLWIVDSGTDRVYQYDAAVSRTSGSLAASTSFDLAPGNTNPQGIADPPVAGDFSRPMPGAEVAQPLGDARMVVGEQRSSPSTAVDRILADEDWQAWHDSLKALPATVTVPLSPAARGMSGDDLATWPGKQRRELSACELDEAIDQLSADWEALRR